MEYRELEDASIVSVCARVVGGIFTRTLSLRVTLRITDGSAIGTKKYLKSASLCVCVTNVISLL